jgi:putative protease
MAVSGKCYISLDQFNFSANRGACLQACRRAYHVKDYDNEVELLVDNKYIMSPKDLCTISFLDKILATGVTVLKIEGRGRGAEYVKTTVRCYREASQSIQEGTYTKDKIESWMRDLRAVYNRDFWDGYYLGQTVGEWTMRYGSQAQKIKVHIGKITNFFSNLNVAEIKIETQDLQLGDTIIISGPTTGIYETGISEIRVDLKPVEKAEKGVFCSIPVQDIVRRNDKVYKWIDNPNKFE